MRRAVTYAYQVNMRLAPLPARLRLGMEVIRARGLLPPQALLSDRSVARAKWARGLLRDCLKRSGSQATD